MTQETARDTAETVTEALERPDVPDGIANLKTVAETGDAPDGMTWEDWTFPVKMCSEVVLEVESCGVGVRWFDVRNDLIHAHYGGSSGWRQVLPGNLRSALSRAESSDRVRVRPVLREEVPDDE